MRKLICLVIMIVFILTVASCGRTPVRDMYVEGYVRHDAGERANSSGNSAEYPGQETAVLSCSGKNSDGFELATTVTVWEPARIDGDMAHPADSSKVMSTYEEIGDRVMWTIPFTATTTNETVGFGAAEYRLVLACLPYPAADANKGQGVIYGGLVIIGDSETANTPLNHYSNTMNIEFCIVRVWLSAGKEGFFWGKDLDITLNEGKTITVYGYVLFVEPERTPNQPDGVTKEKMDSSRYTFAFHAPFYSSTVAMGCPPVVTFTKNTLGDVVFGEKYDMLWQ